MMARVPDYTLKVDDQEIKFLFTYRMIRSFCRAKGIEADEFYAKITKSVSTAEQEATLLPEKFKDVKGFTVFDLH
jgi:hypothetical protein